MGGMKMLRSPSVSFPLRQVMIESPIATVTPAKPMMRGTSVWSWMPKGEMPVSSSRPSSVQMMLTSIEWRPSGRPVDVAQVDREGELVEDERCADSESDCQEIDSDVAWLEGDLEHSADEREHAADDHVMQVDVADAAAAPAVDARQTGIEPGRGEGEKRGRQHEEKRLASRSVRSGGA